MKNLETHQYRLLIERKELGERLENLLMFIHSPAFPNVDPAEQQRLRLQSDHMGEYLNVLNQRVEAIEA